MAASNTATSTTALRFTHSATTPHKLPHFTEKWKALFFCAEHISVKAAAKKYGRKGERKRRRRRRRRWSKTCKAGKGEKKMAQCSALSFFFRQLCFSITSRPRNLCPQTQQQARPRGRRQCRRQRGEERPCVSTRETLTHCPFFFFLLLSSPSVVLSPLFF